MDINALLLKSAYSLASKIIEKKLLKLSESNPSYKNAPEKLSLHLKYIANWSGRIQFLGMGIAKDTDTVSIQLEYTGTPRRFRNKDDRSNLTDELELLTNNNNCILIGDPGAGKTTTLKRLARKLLLSNETDENDIYQYPILLRLREIEQYESIYTSIANVLGFSIVNEKKIKEIERREVVKDDRGNTVKDEEGKSLIEISYDEEISYVKEIGGTEVDKFIIDFLEETNALLLIDGLDELNSEYYSKITKDLSKLAMTLSSSKIILTCRSGQYDVFRKIEGFDILEILSLENSQIISLAKLWICDADKFVNELNTLPYRDLADRPLLLSQLLLIYSRYDSLPRQPKEVYQLVVELLLKEWDADRNIKRKSKYSDFNVKRKSEFLSELSFRLMYEDKKLQFSTADMVGIYEKICDKFELPIEEAVEVATEIETHTELIVSAGFKKYEFSHLSIHEFLCAEYIVRSPLTIEIRDLIKIHPEPIAIATALTSDSSKYFILLVYNNDIFDALKQQMSAFLNRLLLEKPLFSASEEFGFAIFCIFHSCFIGSNSEIKKLISKFFKFKGIKESVRSLLNGDCKVVMKRITVRSKEVQVSYELPLNSIMLSTFKKSFIIHFDDLAFFFNLFNLKSSEVAQLA